MNIYALNNIMLPSIWPAVIPLMNKVIEKAPDNLCLESEYKKIESGNTILVLIENETGIIAINTLELVTFGTGKRSLSIPITSGTRIDEWLDDFLVLAETIAKNLGCSTLLGYSCRSAKGKDAWLRKLNQSTENKWSQVHTQIERKIL